MAKHLAPIQVNVTATDDESFSWAVAFEMQDGTAFPFDEYDIEYIIDSSAGTASVDADNGVVVFSSASDAPLWCGQFEHGCRIKQLSTGLYSQVFDGTVDVAEGNF